MDIFENFTPSEASALFPKTLNRGEKKKLEIIRAAIESIADLGIEKTTFESIGKFLGIRPSHVAYHFPDKDALIAATIQYVAMTARKITEQFVEKKDKPLEKLDAMVEATLVGLQNNPRHAVVTTLSLYFMASGKKNRELYFGIRKAGYERIYSILLPLNEKARLSSRKLLRLAQDIQNILTGFAVDYIYRRDSSSLKQIKIRTVNTINLLLKSHGLI